MVSVEPSIRRALGPYEALAAETCPHGFLALEKSAARPRQLSGSRRPYLLLVVGSSALAALLLVAFCFWTNLDLTTTARSLMRLHPVDFLEILLLMGINSFLAGEKWRLVTARLGGGDGGAPPRQLCFALSAIGTALGQFLPAQIGTALARSVGTRAFGGAVLRDGVGATIFEQLFDCFVAALLGCASLLVIVMAADAAAWALWSLVAIIAGFACCVFAGRAVASSSGRLASLAARIPAGRLRKLLAFIPEPRLIASELTLRLFMLSLLRFVVLVLIGATVANALSLDLPLWHLAAAFPFAVLAIALALTPAALGVGEFTFSSALVALGTPLQVAGQWVIATRILVVVTAALLGLAGMAIVALCHRARMVHGARQAR
jgi:uncharacterized protein (TIRG00374 family)